MKTLSIKNPYGYLIAYGIKNVENRTWKTKFRGRFLIHTSGITMIDVLDKFFPNAFFYLCDEYWSLKDSGKRKQAEKFLREHPLLIRDDLLTDKINEYKKKQELYLLKQQIIGSVELFDIVRDSISMWAVKDCYHWILKNPVRFDNPIKNIKGKLNLWDYDYKEEK